MNERTASVRRDTLETKIEVDLNLDGVGKAKFATGVPFSGTYDGSDCPPWLN